MSGPVHVAARFPAELADELERVARAQDRLRSSIVRRAVRAYLEREQPEDFEQRRAGQGDRR